MNCDKCGQEVKVLKVGDRVEAIGEVAGINFKGKQGIVRLVDDTDWPPVLIEFDKPFRGGHNGLGDGKCKDGHGWWGRHEDFTVIKKEGRKNA